MVVGISADAQPLDEVTRAARKLGMDYPIGSAPDKALERFHVRNLPTTYVIAPDGTIVRSIVGAASDAELGEAIEEAWD
jgi:peroxiredoxin